MPSPCVKKCWPSWGRRFLRFPKERDRQLKWIAILEVPELLNLDSKQIGQKRVCDAHFRAKDLIPAHYPGSNNRALVRGALPIGKSLDIAAEHKDNQRDSSVLIKDDNLIINNKLVAINKVTEDERCNFLPMVDNNLIMKNEMVDNEIFENQDYEGINNSLPVDDDYLVINHKINNCQIVEKKEYEDYISIPMEDNSSIETNRADKDNNQSFLICEDLELNARNDFDNHLVEDEVFLICISHALNTMCLNDKLEFKMRVLEVIKDLKGKLCNIQSNSHKKKP